MQIFCREYLTLTSCFSNILAIANRFRHPDKTLTRVSCRSMHYMSGSANNSPERGKRGRAARIRTRLPQLSAASRDAINKLILATPLWRKGQPTAPARLTVKASRERETADSGAPAPETSATAHSDQRAAALSHPTGEVRKSLLKSKL
jgi:hypothetical protein